MTTKSDKNKQMERSRKTWWDDVKQDIKGSACPERMLMLWTIGEGEPRGNQPPQVYLENGR